MCGICGIRRFGDVPIPRDSIDMLLVQNQSRGLEAAGVALQQADGSIQIFKQNVTAWEFVGSDEYDDFMKEYLKEDTVTVMGHTRKATIGPPKVISNNHPMFAGVTAVIHNGHINNHDGMFKEWKLDRKAETDSDIFRALFDKEGLTRKAANLLNKLTGSAAFAAVSPKYPGKLLLGRSGNPIEFAATNDLLYWSSEKGPLYQVLRPYEEVFGIPMRNMTPTNYRMMSMTDHSVWMFAEKPLKQAASNWQANWLEWHQELKIADHFTPVNYQCHANFFGNRVKFYDDKPVNVVQCRGCLRYLPVPETKLSEIKKFSCKHCHTSLG